MNEINVEIEEREKERERERCVSENLYPAGNLFDLHTLELSKEYETKQKKINDKAFQT